MLVLWRYQIISSCFLNELFKNMYSICSSTSNFSLEKVSTDFSGNFSWAKNIVAILYFVPFGDYSDLKYFFFSQFLWNSLVALFCNSFKDLVPCLHRFNAMLLFLLFERGTILIYLYCCLDFQSVVINIFCQYSMYHLIFHFNLLLTYFKAIITSHKISSFIDELSADES